METITVTAERTQTSIFAGSTLDTTWPRPTFPEITIAIPPLVQSLGKAIISPVGAAIIVGGGIVLWSSETSADSELTEEERAEYDKAKNEKKAKEALNADKAKTPKWPGDNPEIAPEGTEWQGKPGSKPGSKEGNYYNPKTKESYRPDLEHDDPIGPHWDYRDPSGNWHRIYPDGRIEPK